MSKRKRLPIVLICAFLTGITVTLGVTLGWRVVLVVGVFATCVWSLALADRPQEALPPIIASFVPARGKWGRLLLIGTAMWVLLAFPFWVSWILQ